MEKLKEKKKIQPYKVTLAVFTCIFAVYACTLVFPFLWLVINSFRDWKDFLSNPLSFGGMKFGTIIKNYRTVFNNDEFNIFEMYFNSITLVVGQTLTSLLAMTCTAYVVARYTFVGKRFIYSLSTIVMMVPLQGGLITLYTLMSDTGLIDTYVGYLFMNAWGFGFNFFVLYGFFKNISPAYSEAASIDGAGHFTIFWKIMLPQCLPVLVSLGIVSAIGVWNDYYTQMVFYSDHHTVAVSIQTLSVEYAEKKWNYPVFFAAIVVTTLPLIVLYASCQKIIVNNTAVGGLKG